MSSCITGLLGCSCLALSRTVVAMKRALAMGRARLNANPRAEVPAANDGALPPCCHDAVLVWVVTVIVCMMHCSSPNVNFSLCLAGSIFLARPFAYSHG